MSYPEARYDGETGEISALYRPGDSEPELRNSAGGSASYLATGASTNGQFGLYRWNMAASPGGPKAHFHKTISESFFVLSGTVRLFNGERWVDAKPGDFLYVPEGGIHAFRNDGDDPASMLILFAPAPARELYFRELVDISATGRTLTEDEWTELLARHDQYRAT
jgi:mannose-6-phosphate isomerase-like protein (cupin superfamily)